MDTRGSKVGGVGTRRRRTEAIAKSSSCDGMMVKGKKENGAKLAKRKKKKPAMPAASTPSKSSTKMKKSISSPAEVHLPSLKMTTGVLKSSHSSQVNPPTVEKELLPKPDNPPKCQLEPLQCVSCSPTRPASSASAVSSSHTATSSSKTDHDFTVEHCISSISSLRWENALSDEEEEEKRIEIYKANRRKRYRALLEEQKRLLFGSKERRIYVSDGPVTQS